MTPPGRGLAGQGLEVGEFLKLVLGEEAAVGQAGAHVLQVDNALDFGLEGLADLVQEVGQRAVIGGLLDPGAGSANLRKVFEVGFERVTHKGIMPRVKRFG
jgi:hypothetical protein